MLPRAVRVALAKPGGSLGATELPDYLGDPVILLVEGLDGRAEIDDP